MKILSLAMGAALAASSLAVPAVAAERHHNDWNNGHHNGWNNGRHNGWNNGRHHARQRCWYTMRHHHRVRVCR